MFDFIRGAVRSSTVQFNVASILLTLWAAVYQSEFVQSNPEYVAIAAGLQAVVNLLLRAKTKKPLSER